MGSAERAGRYFEEALAISTRAALRQEQAETLTELGILHLEGGRTGEAESALRAALELFRAVGYTREVGRVESLLDACAEAQGTHAQVARTDLRAPPM